MNAITRHVAQGEITPPGVCVRVVGKRTPISERRIDMMVGAGLSISEILTYCGFDHGGGYLVTIGGEYPILPENYRKVRVKAGAVVTVLPYVKDNSLRTILGLAIAVAALVIAPYAAGLFFTAGTFAFAATQALVATGILLAGTLALNALFPVRPKEIDNSSVASSFNSIQGAQNQANPFGAIPVVLGRHRQSPFYAAKPYTEISGDDQYLRLLFCLGYGPLTVENIKIGETPLTSFTNYTIETKQGFNSDTDVTLYPGEVDEVALSVELDGPVDGQFQDGIVGSYSSQTSAVEADEISIDFTATQGVYATDQNGKEVAFHIKIEAQYRAAFSSDVWTNLPASYLYRSVNPTRVGLRFIVTRGQYEVRCRRATGRGSPEFTKDQVIWTALRSFKNTPPVTFPGDLSFIALRIKASDQLSGVINTLNCVTTSLVKAYSGSGSVWNNDTASQNPADLFRHVLQGPANARAVADSKIDIDNLQDWWTYCNDNGFKFNKVITQAGSVKDTLDDIASAGRAIVSMREGKWAVVWDKPDDSIVQKLTPRNSWNFQGQRTYAQQPHGWRVKFINEDNGWTVDERIVYDDGYSASNATLFEGIEFPGVTDTDLIWKHGRFHIAQSRLRPEKITLSVGWEQLICSRGDRIEVAHDIALIGLGWGRIKTVVGQVVTFDEQLTIEDGNTYGMQFRLPGATRSITRAVDVTPAGDYLELTLVGDLSDVTAGTLFSFGLTDQESAIYRVQGISHQKDLIATLTLVDDAPDISTADTGTIPEYTPNVTIPPDPLELPPRDLRYLELIDGTGASVRALVRLTWQVPRFGNIVSFEVQARFDDGGGSWERIETVPAPKTICDVPVTNSGIWSFRVRCLFNDGTVSSWTSLLLLTIAALSSAPDDITNLHIRTVDGQTVLDWDVVNDARQIYYEIRKGTIWDTGLVVGDVVTQPPWATTGDGTYHIRAYILSPFGTKIYSANDASITVADSIIFRNIILNVDEQASGWPGGLSGGVITGSFIKTDSTSTTTLDWAQEVIDQLALSGTHIAVYLSGTIVNIGRAAECRFWTEFEASGVLQGDDFLGQTDVLGSGDVLGTSPTRFIRAFPVWRFADTGSQDVFNVTNIYSPSDIFATDIDWGDWVGIASGTRVSRYFQPGYVLITDREDVDATGTKFSWFVDVPDRTDDYTDLSVPDTGLDITFYEGGYNSIPTPGETALPFNGGPNGSTVPHVQRAIVNGTNGDEVKITNLTASGCTVHVVNAGSNVTRTGVNLLVRGY